MGFQIFLVKGLLLMTGWSPASKFSAAVGGAGRKSSSLVPRLGSCAQGRGLNKHKRFGSRGFGQYQATALTFGVRIQPFRCAFCVFSNWLNSENVLECCNSAKATSR